MKNLVSPKLFYSGDLTRIASIVLQQDYGNVNQANLSLVVLKKVYCEFFKAVLKKTYFKKKSKKSLKIQVDNSLIVSDKNSLESY